MAVKFMQSLDPQVYTQLTKIAKERGITMQELIRAVIVPDWMRKAGASHPSSGRAVRKGVRRLRRTRATVTA